MVAIDKVVTYGDSEVLGVEIQIGDDAFFIAADQAGWPGIRAGKFPSLGGGARPAYVPVLYFETIAQGDEDG